ncbi:MAG: phytoene desaturase family protein [Cyclobacteriaceae bacterium]
MSSLPIYVIGSGYSGLATACYLAKNGEKVIVIEKNSSVGGRARSFQQEGFTFDMGPSWYWMPDVFEKFFADFDKKPSDFYDLERLDPSYQVFYGQDDVWGIPASMKELYALFESKEKGAATKLKKFLSEAKYKYEVGINKLVRKPGKSLAEFIDIDLAKGLFSLDVFQSMHKHVRSYFKNPQLIQLLEFPILFLGAMPKDTPALYSLMNYADMNLGTWYPKGGMNAVANGMYELAKSLGVEFQLEETVEKLDVKDKKVTKVVTNKNTYSNPKAIVAGADYHHVEQHLLEEKHRKYSKEYWDKRVMAPSSLIFYLGINKKVKNLLHHNLFFDQEFEGHAIEIYKEPKWPSNPLFYVCCPSKTEEGLAPEGMENVFILIPVAPDLKDEESIREAYYHKVMDRLEKLIGEKIREHVVVKRSYAHKDFIEDYNSFKGNAYGLANTLLQTAILKPSMNSKKVKNLFYTGQLTVPGPGVPPSLISGEIVAKEVQSYLN